MTSPTFKDPEKGTDAHQIDADTLRCFALLHSQGERNEKAVALYNILQDGGLEAHEQITATDKDFKPNFEKLARLSSKEIFNLAYLFGDGVEEYYDGAEYGKMCSDETMDVMIEDMFLEQVYGAASRLTNEAWLEKVSSEECAWIYTADQMREKVLTTAEVDKKH